VAPALALAVSAVLTTAGALVAQPPSTLTVFRKLAGHKGPVYAVSWTPDGSRVVTTGGDGTFRVFDVESGSEVKGFAAHRYSALCLAVDGPGRRALSGGLDKAVRIWLLPDAGPEATLSGDGQAPTIAASALAPNGERAAVALGRALRVWDLATRQHGVDLAGHEADIVALAWDPSGTRIASCDKAGVVRLWDPTKQPAEIGSIRTPDAALKSLAFRPVNLPQILTGDADGHVRLWDLPGPLKAPLETQATALSPAPDVATVAGAVGPDLVLWDSEGRKKTLVTFAKPIVALDWGHEGKFIAVGLEDHSVQVVSAADGKKASEHLTTSEITGLAFRSSNGWLAVGNAPNVINVFDSRKVKPAATPLKKHAKKVTGLVFSRANPDHLFSASEDATALEWDLAGSGKLLHTFPHDAAVTAIGPAGDGATLYTGSADGNLWAFDVSGKESPKKWQGHSKPVASIALGPAGHIASGSSDGSVRYWDAAATRLVETLGGLPKAVQTVWFAPASADPPRLRVAMQGGNIQDWGTSARQLFDAGRAGILALASFPDGDRFVAACDDKKIRVFKTTPGAPVLALAGHSDPVTSIAVLPGPPVRIVSGGQDRYVAFWDPEHETPPVTNVELPAGVSSVGVLRNTPYVVAGLQDGNAWLLELDDRKPGLIKRQALKTGQAPVVGVGLIRKGASVLTASGQALRIWSVDTGKVLRELEGHKAQVYSVAWSNDGKAVATADADGTTRVFDLTGAAATVEVRDPASPVAYAVAFRPQAATKTNEFATAGMDGVIRFRDAKGGVLKTGKGHTSPVFGIAFDAQGKKLASGSKDGAIWIHDPATGDGKKLPGHGKSVYSVAFNPNSSRLASVDYTGNVKVWDIAAQKEVAALPLGQPATGVAWNRDGNRLAVAASDRLVYILQVP
jgi:WD40 repeat protein